jgi:hypothetical protein
MNWLIIPLLSTYIIVVLFVSCLLSILMQYKIIPRYQSKNEDKLITIILFLFRYILKNISDIDYCKYKQNKSKNDANNNPKNFTEKNVNNNRQHNESEEYQNHNSPIFHG